MKKNQKILSGLTGVACLMSAVTPVMAETQQVETTVEARAEETYARVANVQGNFSFTQDELTPTDDIFSLFGTAATYACAKPGFAFDNVTREEYYLNVGGQIKKNFSISMKDLEKMETKKRSMVCTCASSSAAAMASVTGIPVSSIVSMADLDEGVNTITMKDKEGYGIAMPLNYVLEKEALLVYQINDKNLTAGQGAPVQVWMPDTVAKYFTRQVTEIELTSRETPPEVQGLNDDYRAKVNVLNRFAKPFGVGDQIAFEGYADDCGVAIAAVEFSLDNGATWTTFDTENANPHQWVYWHFEYLAEAPGNYKLDVRARTADGKVSPLASSVVFTVEGDQATA